MIALRRWSRRATVAAIVAAAAAAVTALPSEADAALGFNVEPNGWPNAAHRDAAVNAMQSVVNRYNAYGNFGNYNVYVYYNAGIPTAQANYLGSIGFGGTYPNERVTMHELAHYLGSGTYGDPWDGARGEALVDQFDGIEGTLQGDTQHFWPYGLNFDSEGAEINKQRQVALVYAQRADMGIGSAAQPSSATVVSMTASDALGESAFNYANTWSDNYFAQPGTAYSTGNFFLRTPASNGSFTFVGDSLRINNTNGINGGLLYKGAGATGVTSFKNLILDGGYVRHASSAGDLFRLAGNVTLLSASTIDAGQGAITISASIGGSGSLTKTGSYPVVLTGGSTYSGSTTINAGILRLAPATAVAAYTFDNVSGSAVINGGTGGAAMNGNLANGASIVAGGRFGNAVSLAGGASVDINNGIADLGNNASWTVSSWVKTTTPGGSILTKGDGAGWSNGNTIFYLGDGTAGGSGGIPSSVRWGGGFFQGSAGAAVVNDGNWHQVTYVNSNGAYAIYVDGVAQALSPGNSGFANADIGSVVRLGVSTNTFAGDGTVNYNGLLDSVQFYGQALTAQQIAALYLGQSFGVLPAATDVSIASGATLDVNGIAQQIGSLSGPAGSNVLLGGGRLIVSSANSTQFAGTISGSGGSLVKGGASTLTLAAASNYTGGTTITAGTLSVGNNSALGTGAVMLIGGTLSSANNSGTEPTITNAIVAGGGNIAAGSGTLFRVNGNISGGAALGLSGIFNGAGLRLAGDNSAYTGTATVTGANTRLGSASAGSAAAHWVVNGNLQTDVVGGGTFQFGALSGAGNISGHANNPATAVSTLRVGALNTNTTFAGTIVDNAADDAATGNSDGAQRNVLALTKVGTGTLALTGLNTYTGATTVSGGTLEIHGSQTTTASVTVNAAGAKLRLASNDSSMRFIKTGALSISGGGSVDLTDNKLLTTTAIGAANASGVYNGVQGMVQAAYNFGTWDGPGGLMTSEELASPLSGPLGGTTTIAVNKASEVLFIGDSQTGTFAGQSVTGATTIAMYTYAGDVNLDGLVDATDYGVIDNWVQFAGTGGYANGDFNYDGVIDAGDYGIIDNTIQLQGAPIPIAAPTSASAADLASVSAVPEPATISIVGLAAASLLGRCRRRLARSV